MVTSDLTVKHDRDVMAASLTKLINEAEELRFMCDTSQTSLNLVDIAEDFEFLFWSSVDMVMTARNRLKYHYSAILDPCEEDDPFSDARDYRYDSKELDLADELDEDDFIDDEEYGDDFYGSLGEEESADADLITSCEELEESGVLIGDDDL